MNVIDKVGGGRGDPRGAPARREVGRLPQGDARAGGGAVLAHRAGHVLGDGAALVPRGAGGAPHQAAAGPPPRARAHLLRQPALPRRRGQPDQAGASLQVQGELRRAQDEDCQVNLRFCRYISFFYDRHTLTTSTLSCWQSRRLPKYPASSF